MSRLVGNDRADVVSGYTVRDLFHRAFTVFADRVAVTDEHGSWTYSKIGELARQFAAALHQLGVRQGDRVAVLSEARPEYVVTYAALASLGASALTLNVRLHADELAYCIESGEPVALIYSGMLDNQIATLRDRAPVLASVRYWISFDGDYADLLAAAAPVPPPVSVRAEDLHNVLYTSGTTGRPKGAMISHGAAAIRGQRLAQWFNLTADDGFIGWLPLFHCAGDESLYATMMTGGKYATLRTADAEMMFRMIERDRLTWTLLLPGVLTDFLHHPNREQYDLSSFRFAIGYANMMPHIVQQLTAACGIDFSDAFGQTEVSYLLAHSLSHPGEMPSLRKLPTPLLNVRLVDDEMNDVAVGTPGECVVRGPTVMSGYLDDPAATEEAFRGGWLHTGDMLVRDEAGQLSVVDRKKYLIKSGGENIYPAEVEQVIARHDAVQEVCVFGAPDEYWGETVKAVVVTRPGADINGAELVAWCRQQLAGYKRPRYIQFMAAEDLPRSTTGKLLRHELAKKPPHPEERTE
ncbi:class I adenylate-forming enzyme family protein [Sciscionella marina]|uniref:class I adenylate-forming enzyme family protein n=1 Tax=Sciscionella marina TaxID=508770 RepID=UPI0003A3302B|nr:AMP-binding protein [Sciscionella marina]